MSRRTALVSGELPALPVLSLPKASLSRKKARPLRRLRPEVRGELRRPPPSEVAAQARHAQAQQHHRRRLGDEVGGGADGDASHAAEVS